MPRLYQEKKMSKTYLEGNKQWYQHRKRWNELQWESGLRHGKTRVDSFEKCFLLLSMCQACKTGVQDKQEPCLHKTCILMDRDKWENKIVSDEDKHYKWNKKNKNIHIDNELEPIIIGGQGKLH